MVDFIEDHTRTHFKKDKKGREQALKLAINAISQKKSVFLLLFF